MYLKCGKILCLQFHLLAFISTMVGSQCDHSFSSPLGTHLLKTASFSWTAANLPLNLHADVCCGSFHRLHS